MDLFREKYDLAEKNKKLTLDLNKIKNSVINYEKEIEELHKEIKMLQGQTDSSKNVGLSLKDQESLIQANMKIKQYKELMEKRDKQITRLLQEKIKVKTEMDKLYQKLTSLINESQCIRGDLILKESAVKKLRKDLKNIRCMLDNPLDEEIAQQLGSRINLMENDLDNMSYAFDFVDKEIQTMPVGIDNTFVSQPSTIEHREWEDASNRSITKTPSSFQSKRQKVTAQEVLNVGITKTKTRKLSTNIKNKKESSHKRMQGTIHERMSVSHSEISEDED